MVIACHKFGGVLFVWVVFFLWKGKKRATEHLLKGWNCCQVECESAIKHHYEPRRCLRNANQPNAGQKCQRIWDESQRWRCRCGWKDTALSLQWWQKTVTLSDVPEQSPTNTDCICFGSCLWELFRCKAGKQHCHLITSSIYPLNSKFSEIFISFSLKYLPKSK